MAALYPGNFADFAGALKGTKLFGTDVYLIAPTVKARITPRTKEAAMTDH